MRGLFIESVTKIIFKADSAWGTRFYPGACASVQPGQSLVYRPQSGETPLPDWAFDGPIYEISLRSFTDEGTFKAAAQKLPGIRALGVKTIWLEPFSPMGQAKSSPVGSIYCQKDKRGVDPRFGTLEDFHKFRD